MSLPSQKAKTLKEAYRICDVTPLMEADQKYYVPLEAAQRLFTDYASQLQDLNCVMIYTVSIGSLYTPRGISKSFEDMTIVPMVKVYKYERDLLQKYFIDRLTNLLIITNLNRVALSCTVDAWGLSTLVFGLNTVLCNQYAKVIPHRSTEVLF